MLPTVPRPFAPEGLSPHACVVIANSELPPRILKFRAPAAAKRFEGNSTEFFSLLLARLGNVGSRCLEFDTVATCNLRSRNHVKIDPS